MYNTFQGSGDVIKVTITDENDTVISPADVALSDVEIKILHRHSGNCIAQFHRGAATTDWQQFTVTSSKAYCYIQTDSTLDGKKGSYEVQVTLKVADVNFTGGYRLVIKKGILYQLNPAHNG